jgi:HAD superfamily hydrolase (TIGR01549 family)
LNAGGAPAAPTVLVVSGGGFQGLAVLRALRRSPSVRIVMADCHRENVGRYFADQFLCVPPVAERERFLEALRAACGRERAGLILPSTDYELTVLADEAPAFAREGVAVAVCERALLDRLRDKGAVLRWLQEGGLPVLPPCDPCHPQAPFPLIGKPAQGWGGRGVVVARSAEALRGLPLPEGGRTHVWQPFLEDVEEVSADFSIDFQGRPSALGLRRRLRTTAGFAVVSEACASAELEGMLGRLAARLADQGGRGLFNVQVLQRGSEAYVSDVNPRIGTSAGHWFGDAPHPVLHLCASVFGPLPAADPPRARPGRAVRYLDDLWLDDDPEIAGREAAVAGVVFDLDDTLLPHKRWIMGKIERLCREAAGLVPDPAAFRREALWLLEEGAAPRLLDALAERLGLDGEVAQRLQDAYRAAVPDGSRELARGVPVLETLRRRGLKLAVLTDNPPASQRQKLQATGLEARFDAVVYAREAGGEKPQPAGFAEVARRLELPPEALAMVGDNPHRDVAGAAAAGYGMAYLLSRPGGLRGFDPELFRECSPVPHRRLASLSQLLWYLRP